MINIMCIKMTTGNQNNVENKEILKNKLKTKSTIKEEKKIMRLLIML